MKLKKLTALLLAGIMALSLTACGKSDAPAEKKDETPVESSEPAADDAQEPADENNDDQTAAADLSGELVVWTLANDLISFADKFMETYPDVKVETIVIAPEDYPTKLQSALLGGETEPDIIVGEPQMLGNWYEAGFFEDLNQAPYNAQDYADQIVDYIWKIGQDENGIQRAISYQITPVAVYYRRDIAKDVFGTDDPDEVGKLFADYTTILDTGYKLKDAGYRIFASDAEPGFFSGDSAWVIDGKLNVDQDRYDYMDLVTELYNNDLTAFASQWAAPWYQAMSGPVPILTAETQWGTDEMNIWDADSFAAATEGADTAEVFAFVLPSWGVVTMRDNVDDNAGKYGVCAGPSYQYNGGTFIGISAQSERKELSWEFIKFCTLSEETADWWIEYSQGDTVSLISALEKHKDDTNEIYGGQKLYQFFLGQAEHIDFSKITKYDKAINDAWGAAITAVKQGDKSKEDAVAEFYDVVSATYPELTIER